MKTTIIALCLFLAVTSIQATFHPQWVACDKLSPHQDWETTNILLDAAPVVGQINNFTVCGISHVYEIMPRNIRVTSETGLDLTFPVDGNIIDRSEHCFNVPLAIPQGSNILNLDFVLSGLAFPSVGCANVTLILENNHSQKFLRHSF